jgi:hypothetical protein
MVSQIRLKEDSPENIELAVEIPGDKDGIA